MTQHPPLSPMNALKRSNTAPAIVVIGPSTSGKSTLVYSLVNDEIVDFISIGIGEKSQTTIIPCNFVFDSRIVKNEQFAIRIRKKNFDYKAVSIVIQEALCQLFCQNAMNVEDTIGSIGNDWIDSILEPSDASYHLGTMKDGINVPNLKKFLHNILSAIQYHESAFADIVTSKKKDPSYQKLGIAQIRNIVFEEAWNSISDLIKSDFRSWLDNIGTMIDSKLIKLFGKKFEGEVIQEFSVKENDEFSCATNILHDLFAPMQPYSLVISEMTLACRPREELVQRTDQDQPLRFCLRDTMGLTQVGMDDVSIKNALDIALNCSPDSILLLLSLEERKDVLSDSCKEIEEKLSKIDKMNIPIHVLFTKADKIIENKVNLRSKRKLSLTQKDYDDSIKDVIKELDLDIKRYLEKLSTGYVYWLSLRYHDKSIDPIQKALDGDDLAMHFTPEGLYKSVDCIIKETQCRILPKGIKHPIFVTVKDSEKPAVEIKLDKEELTNIISRIQDTLTKDTTVVNGYQILKPHRLSGRSVTAYWRKLQVGLGHITKASVYGNFSINMKGMLNTVLTQHITNLVDFYQLQSVRTVIDNLDDTELKNLVNQLDTDSRFKRIAFNGINPVLVDTMSDATKNTQIIHVIFKDFFDKSYLYYKMMDKIALQLSFVNEEIKTRLTKTYNLPIDYDNTMRKLQECFFTFFESNDFEKIVIQEIENAMTNLICKMFIAI